MRMERYQLMTMARPSEEERFHDILRRRQVEINFERNIDEVALIKLATRVGGVISMIRDEFAAPRRYIVFFSIPLKAETFKEEVPKFFKGCEMSQPSNPLRPVRIEKAFNFIHLSDHASHLE